MREQEILAIYGTEYKEMTKQLLQEANLQEQIPEQRMPHWHQTQSGVSIGASWGLRHTRKLWRE